MVKNPSDFIGDAVGKSEASTKAILASTLGKVLIIDEAYMLDPGDARHGSRETYKTAVLDMLVAEVQGNPGDDRCVILLGYENRMRSLFQNGNPGLSGRFMADAPFRFTDYSMQELRDILLLDMKARDVLCADGALDAALDILARSRNNQNFSNAREVRTVVSAAISRYQQRQAQMDPMFRSYSGVLEPRDFDPQLGPGRAFLSAPIDCRAGLSNRVSGAVIDQLERYLPKTRISWSGNRSLFRLVPKTFTLKGPPG